VSISASEALQADALDFLGDTLTYGMSLAVTLNGICVAVFFRLLPHAPVLAKPVFRHILADAIAAATKH